MRMILADKLIRLRKRNGWSQEELAEKVGVTRQSISKWEGAQSVPDLDKILQLSRLYEVSVDYLLKEELEEEEYTAETGTAEGKSLVHRIDLEEANDFLRIKAQTAQQIAAGAFLCIVSPVCLFLLCGGADAGIWKLSENAAGAAGMIVLLLLVAAAVALFISCGMKTSRYEYLDKEEIETGYGVAGMVRERKKAYAPVYARDTILGTCICIVSVIPLLAAAFLSEDGWIPILMLCVMLVLVGIGVCFFIVSGIRWASMQKLLEEGEYSRAEKKKNRKAEALSAAFWLVMTAVYLGWSFTTADWQKTWILWPIAGVLYAALRAVCALFVREQKDAC